MFDNIKLRERALLVSLRTPHRYKSADVADYSLLELRQLAETADVVVVGQTIQNRQRPDSKWFIGQGKVEEVKQLAQSEQASTVIFDSELSGGQVRNLEQFLDLKIIDRTQLILDIFAGRAKTREGILQVELAQLNYLLPRLSGHGKNLSRLGGGIGTRGPGETKLETDRRHIRDRISDLRSQLDEVTRHRSLFRERRQKTGVTQVALAGYTNAGKSTLLNQLTQTDVFAENLLFATLDPTSRTLTLPNGRDIVLTDTVGFIQHLPHDLVAAFRATLEEVCEADLILHVVDSSSPMRDLQMQVVQEVLAELGAQQKPQLVVFNKADLLPVDERASLSCEEQSIIVSAFDDARLTALREQIQELLAGQTVHCRIPLMRGDLLALVYRIGEVVEQAVDDEYMTFKLVPNRREWERNRQPLTPFIL
jgi:GTP-binding protein HflX